MFFHFNIKKNQCFTKVLVAPAITKKFDEAKLVLAEKKNETFSQRSTELRGQCSQVNHQQRADL